MKLFQLQCDGCRIVFSYNGFPLSVLRRALARDGWKFQKGKDYCPSCAPSEV
jgi:hypothetical protein